MRHDDAMKGLKMKEELPSADEMERSGENVIVIASEELVGSIRPLIEQAKARVAQSVNSELVLLYWRIGKTIREEMSARKIAGQEEGIVDLLSETLTMEYGRGFQPSQPVSYDPVGRDTFDVERQCRHCLHSSPGLISSKSSI